MSLKKKAFNWKPLSEKQLSSILKSDAFINILEGAVRSGKTIASIIAWMDFVVNSPEDEFLMTGYTIDTLYRNVISDMEKIYGSKRVKYVRSSKGGAKVIIKCKGRVKKTCYCLGANSERSESPLRGMTVAGWYADEVTLYPESFVKQAINRMSLDDAKAFWTMNPDSPYHYINTEFIEQAEKKGFRHWHFDIDDNLALSEEYKENLKKSYSGLWYDRMVRGLWVMANGVIYSMYNALTMNEIAPSGDDILTTWVGIDYGTSNATTFIFSGKGIDGRLHIIAEYYHSGTETMQSKSPSKYAKDFIKWIDPLLEVYQTPEWIFIDPSAEGFLLELFNVLPKKLRNRLAKASNTVKLGIELMTNVIDSDRFRINRSCKHTLKEITTYVWDAKAQKRGEDAPLKENDHCMDPIRYIINGTRLIWKTIDIHEREDD
jgi:PBSX family phage terminase large subunit